MRVVAFAVVLLASSTVAVEAHDGAVAVSPFDASLLLLSGIAGLLYAAGARRLAQRRAAVPAMRQLAFWIGWAALVTAIGPFAGAAVGARFSLHMLQHELLMLVAVPLVVSARPLVVWLWAVPAGLRTKAVAGLQHAAARRAWRTTTRPPVAFVAHGLVVWALHVPSLYEAAAVHEGIHAMQHVMFAVTAALFWWALVGGRSRSAAGASALYIFGTMVHTGVLGAVFALSTSPFYDVYRVRAAAAGVDAVADQQLAGLYMWIPAGLVLTGVGLALVVAWILEAERRAASWSRWPVGVLLAALLTAACDSIPHEEEARRLTGGDPYRGRAHIRQYGCDTCHTIPGVPTADATVGPPLTSVARRVFLAGHLENTPENMMRWIQHPHAFDEKTAMPDMGVTPEHSRDIAAYLYTLQ